MKNISTHLTYGEATHSATAKKRSLANVPTETELENMRHTAATVFEPLREGLGNKPIFVSCFFRSDKVNKAVGGSATSRHRFGEAMDLDGDVYGSPSNKAIFEYLRDHVEFDQLIAEGIVNGKIAWVHVSKKRTGRNRKQILFMYHNSVGKVVYEVYSLARYKQLVD